MIGRVPRNVDRSSICAITRSAAFRVADGWFSGILLQALCVLFGFFTYHTHHPGIDQWFRSAAVDRYRYFFYRVEQWLLSINIIDIGL